MKRLQLVIFLGCVLFSVQGFSQKDKLQYWFKNPPESTKPWIYWYWLNGYVSEDGIRKDLEAMDSIGIGEVLITDVKFRQIPLGPVKIFSDQWWKLKEYAFKKADSLGMKIGLFNSPGWSQAGGPWVKSEESMHYLFSTEINVKGPKKVKLIFPKKISNEVVEQKFLSDEYIYDKSKAKYQLVNVQAFPRPQSDDLLINDYIKSVFCSNPEFKTGELFDKDNESKVSLWGDSIIINIELKEPQTVRHIELIPADVPMIANCKLQCQDRNSKWQTITEFKIDRPNILLMTGPVPFAPITSGFDSVKSNAFRIVIKNGGNNKKDKFGCLSEIKLGAGKRLTNYAERQLIKMGSTSNQAEISRISSDKKNYDREGLIDKNTIIDLTKYVDSSGVLTWECPGGEWIIQGTGMYPTGTHNHPTMEEGRGFEVDKMNEKYVAFHFDSYIGKFLEKIHPENRRALKHVVVDSYEQGPENWTEGFDSVFYKTYGYSPFKWFPVLRGRVVESTNQSERFLWDLRRLIADLVSDKFIKTLRLKSEENGLKLWMENYGHYGFPAEFLSYGKHTNDIGGEFWFNQGSPRDRNIMECRAASSSASIYGKQIVSAESFTSTDLHKNMPRQLKIKGDWALAQGINHMVFHVYIHQPDDRKPGLNAWYGTDFNRNSTWFSQSGSFVDYFKRSTALLQQGKRVTDVAYFIGENVPIFGGSQNLPLPDGFDYDYVNADVLLNQSYVKDGQLMLKSGAAYRVLVLPDSKTMRPELLTKLERLIRDGLVIHGTLPQMSPSLKNYPHADSEVTRLAANIWKGISSTKNYKQYGKGWIFCSGSLAEVFEKLKITKDVTMPNGYVFTHRKTEMDEIYFISNQLEKQRNDTIGFRVTGKQPVLFDAITGNIQLLQEFYERDNRTFVPLHFEPGTSWIIVFRNKKKYPTTIPKLARNFGKDIIVKRLSGEWSMTFDPKMGGLALTKYCELFDWRTSKENGVRYYGGKVAYMKEFTFTGEFPYENYFLNLGRVEAMARVKLNGIDLGTLWCYPYSINISKALKKGRNTLVVEVITPWWNRLIGDIRRGTHYTWAAYANWTAKDVLQPAGLLGPVKLIKREYK